MCLTTDAETDAGRVWISASPGSKWCALRGVLSPENSRRSPEMVRLTLLAQRRGTRRPAAREH